MRASILPLIVGSVGLIFAIAGAILMIDQCNHHHSAEKWCAKTCKPYAVKVCDDGTPDIVVCADNRVIERAP